MGNKLCAPWKKGYRDDDHPWAPKKDSHLLRLWAEIFEVREEDGEICWARVSDDVVPVNITCIQDTPDTVFQITAYNRHVEKIFDVRLLQPGTRITQASECFVHWKDSKSEHEWGLNFTTPVDARRFRDCCMFSQIPPEGEQPACDHTLLGYHTVKMPKIWRKGSFASFRESVRKGHSGQCNCRKASSSSSLQNIPPPEIHLRKAPAGQGCARKASSSGSLRLSPPKRVRGRKATSNPTSPISAPRRAISTPEELAFQDRDAAQAGFSPCPPGGARTPDSQDGPSSHVEAIATVPRVRNRQIPHAQHIFDQNLAQGGQNGLYDNVAPGLRRSARYATENPYQRLPVHPNAHKPIAEREIPYGQYCSNHTPIYATAYHPRQRHTLDEDNLKSMLYDTVENRDNRLSSVEPLQSRSQQHEPELRQFSREPTCIKLADEANDYDNLPLLGLKKTTAVKDDLEQINLELKDSPKVKRNSSQHRLLLPGQSQESGEWPLPPPPDGACSDLAQPQKSPETPSLLTNFDSNTLKKMLRNLPEGSPRYDNAQGFEYIDNNLAGNQPHSSGSSPVKGSSCQGDGDSTTGCSSQETMSRSRPIDLSHHVAPVEGKPPIAPVKPQRIPLEGEGYPDSGISGMAGYTSTHSVRSGDSGRSGRSRKSNTLPPGLGLSSLASRRSGRSSGTSSGGSSSGQHSNDLIRQLGSDTTEVRHLTTSDLSETESESSGSELCTSDSSSIHTMPSESQASFASKSAAVRKAGWLTVKNWLIHKKRRVELAPKRTWKRYWVCLKGTVLLFYMCDEGETVNEDSVPKHMLVIEGGIAQAVPEHPRKEHIFALSTAFGDAYLFEAQSQIELENWISGIHSACASSFARQHGKENTLKLLRSEIQRLENSIDLDIKMKKMAGLQLSVVTDPRSKAAIDKQIAQWDENLEKLYIEQYRLRCYMASLQGSELPNPKNLLSYVAKSTKAALGRVGVFTVTSFHALVCARTPLTAASLYHRKQKRGLLSTFKADSVTKIRPKSPRSFSPQHGQDLPVDLSTTTDDHYNPQAPGKDALSVGDSLIRIALPGNQSIVVGVTEKMSVQEVLEFACNKRQLNPTDHFMRLKLTGIDNFKIPEKTQLLQSEEYESIEICPKILFQIELVRGEKDKDFGFSIEAELAEDADQEDELCVFISEVTKGGVAHRKGLVVGDEVLVLNSRVVADLDMVYIENLLADIDSICMTIRSCRTERPVNTTALMEHADMYIDSLTCPPPPSQSRISDKVIGELIVPAPNWVQADKADLDETRVREGLDLAGSVQPRDVADMSSQQIDHLLLGAEQVTHFCRLLHSPMPDPLQSNGEPPQSKPLTDSQRIRKVVIELIETERAYVKDLNCLIERYLDPLKEETFLSGEDVHQIFGNITEIVQFQKLFLQSLEEAVELEPDFNIIGTPSKFRDEDLRRILFSLGGSFMYYANHFKLYSSFCASHSKAQRVLNPESNARLQEFLRARNPKQQHSATLESYLIKPIQRILKYPLLLRQLKELTDPHTDEHHHLAEALRGMEAVAEHINEMQKIYEEYGSVFEELIKQYKESHPHCRSLELNVGELQMYGSVNWLNALDELTKMKKGTEIITLLFIFKSGVVILCQERVRKKNRPKQASPQSKQPQPPDPSEVTKRYQTAIPVDQLQVRTTVGDAHERHGIWELVHCRSEQEGRPEKVFQFASSHAARRDFIRTIHNTIRESVRRMSVPGSKVNSQTGSKGGKSGMSHKQHHHHHHQHHHAPIEHTQSEHEYDYPDKILPPKERDYSQHHHQQHYIPNSVTGGSASGSSQRRPDTLITNPMARPPPGQKAMGRPPLRPELGARHSMDIEDKVSTMDGQSNLQDFRTRSQTLTDLNNVSLEDSQQGAYPSGSQSTISSERGGAKLLHSSHNPVTYNSSQTIHKDGLGSPIWKPRHQNLPPKKHVTLRETLSEERPTLESAVFSGSAYGDYSNVIYDEPRKAAAQYVIPPNAYIETEDTEC